MERFRQLNLHIKTVEYDSIIYSINEEEKTVSVISSKSRKSNIFIPRCININDEEYIVTSISEDAFRNSPSKSIQFPPDSEIQVIKENAFVCSSIESFTIPPKLTKFDDGWCQIAPKLNEINMIKENPCFTIYDNKFILGKSTSNKENFDVLIFCIRNIEKVTIPNFIEIIGPYSFNNCSNISEFEFENDSKLRKIEKFAFFNSSIKSLSIPPHLTQICERAFFMCQNLETIEIPENSELEIIEKSAFSFTQIKILSIPSKVTALKSGWCSNTKLEKVKVSEKNECFKSYDDQFIVSKSSPNKENFDVLIFCVRNAEKVTIPDFIEIIEPYTFGKCNNLKKVEFTENSNLRIIGKYSFSSRSLESFTIPSKLIELNEGAFKGNSHLNKFIVMRNNPNFICYNDQFLLGKSSSEKANFDVLHFSICCIKNAVIPNFIEIISGCAFSNCNNLRSIKFPSDSRLRVIEIHSFSSAKISKITFPPHLTIIGFDSFSSNNNLREVEFMPNSELQTIDINAFSFTSIEVFPVQKSVTRICDRAFYGCNFLRIVMIPEDSMLQVVEREGFANTPIGSFHIPPHLTQFGQGIFNSCPNLKIIEFDENSELKSLESSWLTDNENTLIMIPDNLRHIIIH